MTIQYGDTGKVAYGTSKTFNIAFASPRETLLGSPASLPTAEPGTSQISFTVQNSDLPSISPSPFSVVYSAFLYAGGKNTDTASQSVSYRILKNGTSITTGTQSSIATNVFWTHSYYNLYNVSVGDVLEIRLWSSSANVNYDYYALLIYPTRANLGKSYLNKDVLFSNATTPALTLGNPSAQNTNGAFIYPSTSTSINIPYSGGSVSFGGFSWNTTYQSLRIDRGDNTIAMGSTTHNTYRPYYQRQWIAGTITFREILR